MSKDLFKDFRDESQSKTFTTDTSKKKKDKTTSNKKGFWASLGAFFEDSVEVALDILEDIFD